ncbi:DUF3841 domain-containing protein [Microbacterium sp. JZ101]
MLVGDFSRGFPEFQDAYAWMRGQMERRVPAGPDGLVWFWVNPTRRLLRSCARRAHGEVLLTVTVAREQALVSDFDGWHAALNGWLHVPRFTNESEDDWERRADALDRDIASRLGASERAPFHQWPAELRAEAERSWEAIFDPDTWDPRRALQATMRELKAEDVIRASRIL